MTESGCRFVVASGDQYWRLVDAFPGFEGVSFVADNGAIVTDAEEVVFVGAMGEEAVGRTLAWLAEHPDVICIMSCAECAYLERGRASQAYFEKMGSYYHRLAWVDDLGEVTDRVLKFALNVARDRTLEYVEQIREALGNLVEPTSSGYGAIDLIVPGNHKAAGLRRLLARWDIDAADCVAFGDGGNDVEMLCLVGRSYAVEGASPDAVAAAGATCPSCDEQGVLSVLEELFG